MATFSDEVIRERAARGQVAYEALIEKPVVVRPQRGELYVVERRSDPRAGRFRSTAVSAALIAATLVFVSLRAGGWEKTWVLLSAVPAWGLAYWAWQRANRHNRTWQMPLAWLSLNHGFLRLRENPEQIDLSGSVPIEIDQVSEVIYATRAIAVPGASAGAKVDGAGVFVRLESGAVWPVIPSTFMREEAFSIAMAIARPMMVGVKQVGSGWNDEVD